MANTKKPMKRDTTLTLFDEVLKLVKKSGHYKKAAAIMDYYLPDSEAICPCRTEKPLELSNYRFDFNALAYYGRSEGIYIDVYLDGEYTETPIKKFNHSTGEIYTETRRSIGTFKTLRRDLEAMQIMGELCGTLTHYADKYINKHIDRYTPTAELPKEQGGNE